MKTIKMKVLVDKEVPESLDECNKQTCSECAYYSNHLCKHRGVLEAGE